MKKSTSRSEKIKQSFNKAAPHYDNHCYLQQLAGRNLIALIKHQQQNFPRIVDLGCGTGMVTREVATELTYRDFHALDIADQFIIKAKENLANFSIKVYEFDFNQVISDGVFDLIFANMSLHWSKDLTATMNNIHPLLNQHGLLAFTLPLPETLHELNRHCRIQKFIRAETIVEQLKHSGYEILVQQTEKVILPFDTLLHAIKSLKAVGANYVARENTGLGGNQLIKKLLLNNANKNFNLTYNIGYFIVKKVVSNALLKY